MNETFRLDSAGSSILLSSKDGGIPVLHYWGPRLADETNIDAAVQALGRPLPRATLDLDVQPSLLPETGLGWFGSPGILGERKGRDWATRFEFVSVERSSGLSFQFHDADAQLDLQIDLTLDHQTDVVERQTVLTNRGDSDYRLTWCAAGAFAVTFNCAEILSFQGHWSQEFQERRILPGMGIWSRENRRGRTSHDSFPGLIIGTEGFGETHGRVFGFHLGWSGNHRLVAERSIDGSCHVQLGELLVPGEITLKPGESYQSPTVYATFSNVGLNGLSQRFHGFVRERLLKWPGGEMRPRPVHVNTWEAVYFDHDPHRLEALVEASSDVGAERFVLDDGWFRGRKDDTAGLGDWIECPEKYADGLGPLVRSVHDRGMAFGLWVEPEMVNPKSDLYRTHPDWAMHLEGRPLVTGRQQLVLDLTMAEVSDYLFDALDRILTIYPIDYLKWDMNRDLAPAASAGQPAYRSQTLAVYALIDRLRVAHPSVEIESCASGGGRVDYGILKRTHRVWTSDCNDPVERQTIQKGFLRFFPPEVQGGHVGPSPTHTTGRRLSLNFRALTALFGHFGIEADILAMTPDERSELRSWVELYKRYRGLIHSGRYFRADPPSPGMEVYGSVALDRKEAVFAVCQTRASPLTIPCPVTLPGLDPDRNYNLEIVSPPPAFIDADRSPWNRLRTGDLILNGDVLDKVGFQPPILAPETGFILYLRASD